MYPSRLNFERIISNVFAVTIFSGNGGTHCESWICQIFGRITNLCGGLFWGYLELTWGTEATDAARTIGSTLVAAILSSLPRKHDADRCGAAGDYCPWIPTLTSSEISSRNAI
jgi:hypothetical protein